MYRKDDQNIINFKPSEAVVCGNRIKHLEGKEVVIAEKVGEDIKVYWELIYKNL